MTTEGSIGRTPADIRGTAIARIARQSGLPVAEVHVSELALLAGRDRRNPTGAEFRLLEKYVIRRTDPRRSLRNDQMLAQQSEVALGAESIGSASYGVSLPSYLRGLRSYRDGIGLSEESASTAAHKSLLVGALTADTLREYDTAVKTVFPNGRTNVVDLTLMDPDEIPAEIDSFTQGDALAMDFPDGTFDLLHTNYLLPALKDIQDRDPNAKRKKFFAEAARVLNERGALMMVESGDPIQMEADLREAGFTEVTITPNQRFKNRTRMEEFFGNDGSEPSEDSIEPSNKANFIIAKKSPTI